MTPHLSTLQTPPGSGLTFGGKTLGRVTFRGHQTCSCVADSLPWVEWDLQRRQLFDPGELVTVYQWGYNKGVEASAGTHDAGGCIDTKPYGSAVLTVFREWGWAIQDRSPFFDKDHWHGWPYRCGHLAPAAQKQETGPCGWDNKRNGLLNCGPVFGLWPIKPWYKAMEENVAGALEDAKKAIAIQVLNQDGEISNANKLFTGNVLNPDVSLATALEQTKKAIDAIAADVRLIKANLKL